MLRISQQVLRSCGKLIEFKIQVDMRMSVILLVLSVLLSPLLWSQDYKIQNYTILSSADDARSETYHLKGGLAEWSSEISSSQEYLIDSGFWGSMYQKFLSLEEELLLPEEFSVSSAYSNPFNPTTTIDFALPAISDVRIVIYDILGREVFRYDRHSLEAGYYQFNWNGSDHTGRLVCPEQHV